MDRKWDSLRFGALRIETNADNHVFEVEIFLNDLDLNEVRVELYADGINGGGPVRAEMECARPLPDASAGCLYHAAAPALRPAGDYTARVMPRRPVWRFPWNTLESCGNDRKMTLTNYWCCQDSMALFDGKKTMSKASPITCVFVDIDGVLLTDGWDHHARKRAATNFKLEFAEMDDRHHLNFATFEEGKRTLEEYLSRVVFQQERSFTRAQFRRFLFAQPKPYPEMIELIARLKVRHGLKIAVVSNEARELNKYRIRKFKLDGFVDFFISSCFVHVRKPDADIFRLALDVAQAPAGRVVYIENTPMFLQIAEGLGIRSILHTDYVSTCAKLASLGLRNDEGVSQETGQSVHSDDRWRLTEHQVRAL